MNLNLEPDDRAFLVEVRTFLTEEYPQDLIAKARSGTILSRADQVRSQQALQAAVGWRRVGRIEQGGPGWSALRRFLFERESTAPVCPA